MFDIVINLIITGNTNMRKRFRDDTINFGSEKLLTREEEIKVFTLIEKSKIAKIELIKNPNDRGLLEIVENGKKARDKAIMANTRLVIGILKFYNVDSNIRNDLISEGFIGIIKAVEKFDLSFKCKFSTYAQWWIKQSISIFIKSKLYSIHTPDYMINIVKIYQNAEQQLLMANEIVNDKKIIAITKFNSKTMSIVKLAMATHQTVSISQTMDRDGKRDGVWSDWTDPVSKEKKPIDITIENEDAKILAESLKFLTPKERDILILRYGIKCEPMILKEIGEVYGVTKEMIRQTLIRSIEKLKRYRARKMREESDRQIRNGLTQVDSSEQR